MYLNRDYFIISRDLFTVQSLISLKQFCVTFPFQSTFYIQLHTLKKKVCGGTQYFFLKCTECNATIGHANVHVRF